MNWWFLRRRRLMATRHVLILKARDLSDLGKQPTGKPRLALVSSANGWTEAWKLNDVRSERVNRPTQSDLSYL
jgi:hypothetical protein